MAMSITSPHGLTLTQEVQLLFVAYVALMAAHPLTANMAAKVIPMKLSLVIS